MQLMLLPCPPTDQVQRSHFIPNCQGVKKGKEKNKERKRKQGSSKPGLGCEDPKVVFQVLSI